MPNYAGQSFVGFSQVDVTNVSTNISSILAIGDGVDLPVRRGNRDDIPMSVRERKAELPTWRRIRSVEGISCSS